MRTATNKAPVTLEFIFGTALILIGFVLVCYAGLLLVAQGWTWLKSGVWQQLPMYSLFLTKDGQRWAVASMAIDQRQNLALAFVPAFGGYDGAESLARGFTGSAEGAYKIALHFVNLSLGACTFAMGAASFYFATKLLDAK